MFNKKAQVRKPLTILIQLILISVAAVAMLGFVSQLNDNTFFQKQMLLRESVLSTMAIVASPYPGFTAIIHQNLPMEKFTFTLQNNKVSVEADGFEIDKVFGGYGHTAKQPPASGGFVVSNIRTLTLRDKEPEFPYARKCPKKEPTVSKIKIDAGGKQTAQTKINDFFEARPFSLSAIIETIKIEDITLNLKERKKSLGTKGTVVSIQFDNTKKPRVIYNIENKESYALACNAANFLSTRDDLILLHPVNPEFLADDNPAQLLDKNRVAIQIIIPESFTRLDEVWNGIGGYLV